MDVQERIDISKHEIKDGLFFSELPEGVKPQFTLAESTTSADHESDKVALLMGRSYCKAPGSLGAYELQLSMEPMDGHLWRTRTLSIHPKCVLINSLDSDMEVSVVTAPQCSAVHPNTPMISCT